jgi:hypothetical protein
MTVPNQTLLYVVQYVQQHPNCKHSTITGTEREASARRRDALATAVALGYLTKSPKRPWTYSAKETQQ